ncbi:YSIRK-type signal peptide-containing protein, partial [uncultured Gemella sp.]|uniref:YSIRK-type signal peptide-containing protein n=1 Tax=uncultured Gemella sp. TaxID=254352 RepID=UPI0028E40541
MVGKNNHYLKDTKQGTKVESYSIKKFKVGAASVVVGASIFFGAGAVAQAAEEVSSNTTTDKTLSDEKSEVTPKTVAKTTVENTKESVASAVAEKAASESTKETAKAEVKKDILKASVESLEEKLKTAQDADKTAVETARKVLEEAKAVLASETATQEDVNTQVVKVQALSTVLTEAKTQAFDKKLEEKKAEEQKDKEAKATKEEKELSGAKKELAQVASEAEVTNKLAKTELSKKELKVEAKPAVEKAVVKNEEVLKLANELLGNDEATKEQVAKSLAELSESIKAVYSQLETAGSKRNGKFEVNLAETATTALTDGTTELGKKWLEDHGYTTLADVPIKKNSKEIATLNDQIQWLDFSDTSAWTNLKNEVQLQIGSQYQKQIMPGYVVTLTVKELKPFETTEAYKQRVAGTEHAASYDADKENKFNRATGFGAVPQHNTYTNIRERGNGINTGNHKTTIAPVTDTGSQVGGVTAGIIFSVSATYNNKPVQPGIVMASGEDISAGELEAEIYTTNGTPWDLAGVIGRDGKTQYKPTPNFQKVNATITYNTPEFNKALAAKMFATRDSATAGLGSQIFGSYSNGGNFASPIVSSANVTEAGIYIISAGQQSTMVGIKISDFGDLPASYGTAEHFIRTETTDWNTNVVRQIQQPFLGTEKADVDSAPGIRVRGEGSDDRKDSADEGVKQLIDAADVHENKDTGEPEVKLVKAPDDTYEVNIRASVNGNTSYNGTMDPAYVRGFIDFNNNGKFDADEASDIVKVTENNQKVTLRFRNTQIIDTTKETVNFRVRIAKEESQVEKPVGIAYSGEVEDNQIQVAIPPRGDKEETTGVQGETQSIDFEFVNRAEGDDASNVGSGNGKTTFNSYGKLYYSEQRNNISLETTKVKQSEGVMIVKPDGSLAKTYTKDGQGTYNVTDTGVTFTPVANFVGKADGVALRAVDANGQTTGWKALTERNGLVNNNTGIHSTTELTMDAVYIPNVTPKTITADPKTSIDIQGKEQTGTPVFKAFAGTTKEEAITPTATHPAKLINPTDNSLAESVTVENEGTYTINPTTGVVTFKPLPTFKGKAKGIGVSLTVPVGADKAGTEVTATATTTYTPEVVPVVPTATPAESTNIQGEEQSGVVAFAPGKATIGDAEKTVELKPNSAKLLNADGSVPTEATVPAYKEDGVTQVGTYSVDPATNTVKFTPTDKTYVGKVLPANVQAEDVNGTVVKTTYTPHIVGVTPTATPAESTNIQGEEQSGVVAFAPGKATIDNVEKTVAIKTNSAKLVNADGSVPTEATVPAYAADGTNKVVGTYSLDPATNTVKFTPTDKSYKGTVLPANVQAEDENGTTVKTTYTPHIVGVAPTADPATSTDVQGAVQSKEVTFTPGKADINGTEKTAAIDPASFKLLGENGQPAESVPAKNPAGEEIGTYTLSVVDGKPTVVLTPTNKAYSGAVKPVTVQAADTNGTTVTTTYIPTITPIKPTGIPVATEGIQGAEQSGTPTFTQGSDKVPMKIDNDQPAKLVDPETGNPTNETTIPAKDAKGNTVGTYTIKPTTGEVTFTPNKDFAGTPVPATVEAKDANGTPAIAKYTPTVKPATPTAENKETEGIQGATQEATPVFTTGKAIVKGTEVEVPLDNNIPAKLIDPTTKQPTDEKSVTVPNEGTYKIDETGKVTFTPEKTFTGTAKGIEIRRVDTNGTPATAKYTPTVKPATPTATDAVTEDVQGATQKGLPQFLGGRVTVNGEEKIVPIDETKSLELIDPKTETPTTEPVVVPGEGTYTINNGMVEFTPEKTFTGKTAGIGVRRVDTNGTPATAKYTPVVKPATPISSDVITTNVQGAIQEGTPTFKGGKVTINGQEKTVEIDENVKPKFDDGTTEKVVPNEGTYTIDENGKVTFTPEKTFTGQATGVTVKRVDKNGTSVTAKYTPVVIPVSPTSKDAESEGPKGKSQEGTPTFTGGKVTINGKEVPVEIDENVKPKFDDGTTEKVVPNEGTYTIDENGKVTFTPEPNFVGKAAGVTVKRVDKNGTEITAKYTPTVRPDTRYVVIEKDGKETELIPSKDGAKPSESIPGYNVVKTEVDEKGNTKHIYEKVKTSFKDKEGNE